MNSTIRFTLQAIACTSLFLLLLAACVGSISSNDTDACTQDKFPCDDADLCTIDTCEDVDGIAQCTNTPVSCGDDQVCWVQDGACYDCIEDEDCDDGSFCNGVEQCISMSCFDGEAPCLNCNEDTDECESLCFGTEDDSCDDGDACNGTESCQITPDNQAFECVAGEAVECADGQSCIAGECVGE